MFRKILVPTDGSELSDKAINAALDAAKKFNGSIVGLCVSHPYPFLPVSEAPVSDDAADYENHSREIAQRNVEKIRLAAIDANVPCDVVLTKSFDPAKDIVDVANKWNCDSIFMASHGHKGVNRLILGSKTLKVLTHANLPVLVCR